MSFNERFLQIRLLEQLEDDLILCLYRGILTMAELESFLNHVLYRKQILIDEEISHG